jgi:AcrR family transcriptional regulator
MAGRRSDIAARGTRDAILRRAAEIASAEGLEGLTIGRLADDLAMSKAGVIGHFGSKEELQLATLELAADDFRDRVWAPASFAEPGLARLLRICEAWTAYADAPSYPGGCFIAAASFEFDGRPGRVRDALAAVVTRWRKTLRAEVAIARDAGDLPPETDPDQVAYSLEALASGMNPARQLHGDTEAGAWTLRAMHAVIGVAAARAAA